MRFLHHVFVPVDLQIGQKRVSDRERKLSPALFFVNILKMNICGVKVHLFIIRPGCIRRFSQCGKQAGIASLLTEIQIIDGG